MSIDLKKLAFIPFCMVAVLMSHVVVSFTVFEFLQPISYIVWGLCILFLLISIVFYLKNNKMTLFEALVFIFYLLLITFTVINANDIKGALYFTVDGLLLITIFSYYRERLPFILKSAAFILSVIIYLNLTIMILFPNWMFAAKDVFDSYLLGGNYNQIGCRLLLGLVTSVLCVKYSKWWILNTIFLFIVSIVTLALVGSMTSLSNIIIFALFCLIPSVKLKKAGIIAFFSVYVIFQIFVVFNGEGLHNNEMARYLIEDVLQKDITFSNRTYRWDDAGRLFVDSPVIGYGLPDRDWYLSHLSSQAIGPHNFIYAILLYGGVVLLAVLIIIAFVALKRTVRHLDNIGYLVLAGTVTLLFMMTMEVYPPFFLLYFLLILYNSPLLFKK